MSEGSTTNVMGDKLLEFIGRERARFEDSNVFTLGLGHVSRYYRFLNIIYGRYTELSAQCMENTWRQMELCKTQGSGPVGPDLLQLNIEAQGLHDRLHLEIESFFMFGTVFLDRAACFIEWYFGRLPVGRINSHRQLKNKLSDYVSAKDLILPQFFKDSIDLLEDSLAEFRDKEIVHDRSPRSMHMTQFNADCNSRCKTRPR